MDSAKKFERRVRGGTLPEFLFHDNEDQVEHTNFELHVLLYRLYLAQIQLP